MTCFECGNPADVRHHVVPVVRGGTNTVPLCDWCHNLVHDSTLRTLKKQRRYSQVEKDELTRLYYEGLTIQEVADRTGLRRETVFRLLRANGTKMRPRGQRRKTPKPDPNIKWSEVRRYYQGELVE